MGPTQRWCQFRVSKTMVLHQVVKVQLLAELIILLSLSAPGMKDHLFQRMMLDIIERNENQSDLEEIIEF